MRTGLDRCSSLASTGGYWIQGLSQVKEFDELLFMRARRPFSSSLCISRRMNRKNGMIGHHEGGTVVTPFSHFFLYRGYVMWRQPRSSVGSNSLAAVIRASFFRNRFAGIRRSQWVYFMLNESMRGNLISPLTQFSNGRKRNLRPIHSLDQGDWTGRATVNGFPPPTFQERRVAMDDLTPPGHTGPPTRGRASDRSC